MVYSSRVKNQIIAAMRDLEDALDQTQSNDEVFSLLNQALSRVRLAMKGVR